LKAKLVWDRGEAQYSEQPTRSGRKGRVASLLRTIREDQQLGKLPCLDKRATFLKGRRVL